MRLDDARTFLNDDFFALDRGFLSGFAILGGRVTRGDPLRQGFDPTTKLFSDCHPRHVETQTEAQTENQQ